MRMNILIVALALTSTTAYAGPSRSLSLAAYEPAQTASQPAPAEKSPQASKPSEKTREKVPDKATGLVDKPASVNQTKRKREPTEARVIYELHRHGIYW